MRTKVAKALFRQRDPQRRRRLMIKCSVALLLLFLVHSYFSNLSSPLKLIPQTIAAIAMGYLMLYITSLRQFKHVAEFIDWAKVNEMAEPGAAPNGGSGTQPGNAGATAGPPSAS